MQFKTNGGISPQGIPKLYYTAHPKDFSLYFDSISDLILERQNCGIFFDPDPEHPEDGENFYSLLDSMQLIVIPITSNFLERECLARSGVFTYAMEQRIPVLPILEESVIEARFNEVCGNLQFLNPHEHDLTAIPFEKKLSTYLNSVLIGDELAQKIRKAFDAYIFMSYRKKDRKEAQKLMRMIHENPFCRDIAIWYDEYLVPGENFNQAIQEAMRKSELFALTVTPSLLENPNYVMTHEFPDARELGMKILPVEMRETDQEQLRTNYTGIPDCIRPEDTEALAERLIQTFSHLSGTDRHPEHEYFMGLAYLGGIDVEVNHERAVELITSAAEQELPEAMKKLVSMYHIGEGVEQNYETMIEWQRKLADLRKKQFEQEQSEDRGIDWVHALYNLGDFIQKTGQNAEAEEVYKEMLSVCERLDRVFNSKWAKRHIGISYVKLGNICKFQGNLKTAKVYHEKSLAITESLATQIDSVISKMDLRANYGNLGSIYKMQGDLKEAQVYYKKSLSIAESLVEQTNSDKMKINLSTSYSDLGDIYKMQGELKEAKFYYEKALVVMEEFSDPWISIEVPRMIAVIYEELGDICKMQGDLKGAMEFYQKSLTLNEKLSELIDSVKQQIAISHSYHHIGEVYEINGDPKTAKTFYEKSLAIVEKLTSQTDSITAQNDLLDSYERLGYICEVKGELEEARAYYEKSLAIAEIFTAKTDFASSQQNLSIIYHNLGYVCKLQNDLKNAQAYYEKSLAISEQLFAKTNSIQLQRVMSIVYSKLGDLCEEQDDLANARAYFEKSLEITLQIANHIKTAEIYDDLAVAFHKLAFFMESKQERTQYLLQAAAIWQKLNEQCPHVRRYAECLNIVREELEE